MPGLNELKTKQIHLDKLDMHMTVSYAFSVHFNIIIYNAVFNINTQPCHGSQMDYFAICLKEPHYNMVHL